MSDTAAPEGGVILGYGETFKVPTYGFRGWVKCSPHNWLAQSLITDPYDNCLYAAPYDSEVVRLNRPSGNPGQETGTDYAASLGAMAHNYQNGHSWDDLDGEVCLKAAAELTTAREAILGHQDTIREIKEAMEEILPYLHSYKKVEDGPYQTIEKILKR